MPIIEFQTNILHPDCYDIRYRESRVKFLEMLSGNFLNTYQLVHSNQYSEKRHFKILQLKKNKVQDIGLLFYIFCL